MLEVSNIHVVCGGVLLDDDFVPVYANIITGDVAYETPETGESMLISEISIDNPLPMSNLPNLEAKLRDSKDYIGLIMRDDGQAVYLLDEDTAALGNYSSVNMSTVFSIDMNFEYEYDVMEEEDID